MLNPASVDYCPWCGYPLGILANHTNADDTPLSFSGTPLPQEEGAPAPPTAVYHNVVYTTAPRRISPILLLSMAGLTLLMLAGIVLACFPPMSTVTITPWVSVAASGMK
jgi:hypothetical protein